MTNLVTLDVRALTELDIARYHELLVELRGERGEPAGDVASTAAFIRGIPSFVVVHAWASTDDTGALTGLARIMEMQGCDAPASADIYVRPRERRRGLGRRLAQRLVEHCEQRELGTICGSTSELIPAGGSALRHLGAVPALDQRCMVLSLGSCPIVKQLPPHGLTAHVLTSPVPAERLDDLALLQGELNDRPRGDLRVDDLRITPDFLRERERWLTSQGVASLAVALEEVATGRFVAWTEATRHPDAPAVAEQVGTAVARTHRGRGLSLVVKALHLEALRSTWPDTTTVRTTTALTNDAMRSVNLKLGFKESYVDSTWQIDVRWLTERLGP